MSFDPLTAAFDIGGKILDKIFPNPAERDLARVRLLELQQNGELAILAAETGLAKGQQEINAEEAKSASVFVAGWRPFIGWTCGMAFAYHFIAQPLLVFGMASAGKNIIPPTFDMDALNTVLMGMLGIGGMRSFEKYKGVAK